MVEKILDKKQNDELFVILSGKPKMEKFRLGWFHCCRKKKYEQLQMILNFYTQNDIKAFFKSEGRLILVDALNMSDAVAFNFIIKNISKESILSAIREENYLCISYLLMIESGKEEDKRTNENTYKVFLKKLIFCLD